MQSPFIIWTLRRSGGTNLGAALFNASSFSGIQHEPFNGDRVFGYIVKQWKEDKNNEQLRINIREVLKSKPLIKHCFEIMPDELNLILAEESQAIGYQHLFLYREYAADRLLSLNYSLLTGVWGKQHAKSVSVEKEIFSSEIDVDHLIQHEKQCRRKMYLIYNALLHMKVKPLALTFENLYRGSYEYSKALTKHTFFLLGLESEAPSDDKLFTMLRGGGQGTKDKYMVFPHAQLLVDEATKLGRFDLIDEAKFKLEYFSVENKPKFFEIWQPLKGVTQKDAVFSGVLYNTGVSFPYELFFESEQNGSIKLTTGLSSPRIEKLFNGNGNSSNARFISPVVPKTPGIVTMCNGNETIKVCKISRWV